MNSIKPRAVLVIALLALIAAACGVDRTGGAAPVPADDAAADGAPADGASADPGGAASEDGGAGETLRVGVATAQSGALAPYDQPSLDGLRLRVDELNAAGGIDGRYPVELLVRDTRSDAGQTAQVAGQLLSEGIDVLITPCDADPSIAAGQLAQQRGVPAISFCASTPTLPLAVGDHMFSNFVADNAQAAVLARYAIEQGYRSAYVLSSPDSAYTEKLPTYFAEAFEDAGGTVVARGTYSLGQPNFEPIVTEIRALDPQPDVIMTSAYEPDFPAFLTALRSAGVATPVLESDAIDSPTTFALGEIVDGVVYTSAGLLAPEGAMEEFYAAFEQEYGAAPETLFNATGYDLGLVLEAAVEAAGGTDPGTLRDAIAGIEDLQGVTGSITYAGTQGMPDREVALIRIVDGQRELQQRVTPDPESIPDPE